jgi:hypothetical protein
MRIGAKCPAYNDQCVPWLESLSKAALIDCVVDLLRGGSLCVDDAISAKDAIERLSPVLAMRGDRVPKVRGA